MYSHHSHHATRLTFHLNFEIFYQLKKFWPLFLGASSGGASDHAEHLQHVLWGLDNTKMSSAPFQIASKYVHTDAEAIRLIYSIWVETLMLLGLFPRWGRQSSTVLTSNCCTYKRLCHFFKTLKPLLGFTHVSVFSVLCAFSPLYLSTQRVLRLRDKGSHHKQK